MSATYKPSSPSPLSFGSPRTSPFRRPESPSPSLRPSSPFSPTKSQTPAQSPSKLQNTSTPISNDGGWMPRSLSPSIAPREPPTSPTRGARTVSTQSNLTAKPMAVNTDALSKLPTAQARELREAFQVLDRNGDGQVGREDVVDMLTNLGIFSEDGRSRTHVLMRGCRPRGESFYSWAVLPTRCPTDAQYAIIFTYALLAACAAVVSAGAGQCVCSF